MENYSIKSVAFGGFDKQDVIQYIEKSAQEAAAVQKQLQEENEVLREQLAAAMKELDELRSRVRDHQERLQQALRQEAESRKQLELLKPLETEAAALRTENEALRPDAEAYAQFKESLGNIECEARKRAADLEEATSAQLRRTVDLFRAQYQELMSTFESTAAHVNSELRKVEVNLSQLPRAMDQSGNELNQLAAILEEM